MNQALVDRIARTVLYEGYILYPYRPSTKNRQRWTFGGLVPEAYSSVQHTGDSSTMQTECLVADGDPAAEAAAGNIGPAGSGAVLDVKVCFLHLMHRQVGRLTSPPPTQPSPTQPSTGQSSTAQPSTGQPPYVPVDSLVIDGAEFHTWQEAVEREVRVGPLAIAALATAAHCQSFALPAAREIEPLLNSEGQSVGVLVREQQPLSGLIELYAEPLPEGLHKIVLRITNRSALAEPAAADRDAALLSSLISTHAVLHLAPGRFVSLLETPEHWRSAAAGCRQTGLWPVLVGDAGESDAMLASPIILYDYPQVAAESPGDLFDGGEIDEILTLRILTLTDAEKHTMAAVDERARALLERTESLASSALASLHGTMRERRCAAPAGESEHAT